VEPKVIFGDTEARSHGANLGAVPSIFCVPKLFRPEISILNIIKTKIFLP